MKNMYEEVLKKIKSKVIALEYIVTIHAEEEISDDYLSIYDVENTIKTGSILERQLNKMTGESKYRIRGYSLDNQPIETIVKFSLTDKVVIITVYAL
jgi:hypothetical protein